MRSEGCCALKSRLRVAAMRAFASFVQYDWVDARKVEPLQCPGGSGLAAMRAEVRRIDGGSGGEGSDGGVGGGGMVRLLVGGLDGGVGIGSCWGTGMGVEGGDEVIKGSGGEFNGVRSVRVGDGEI